MAKYNIPFIDASSETSTASIAVVDAETDLNLTAIFNAIVGVTLGNAGTSTLVVAAEKDAGSGVKPSNKEAQREKKWLVTFVDNVTGKKGRMEIPCADLSLLGDDGSTMVTSAGAGASLVSALNAHGLSSDGNPITVSTIRFVGRNT